MHLEVFTEEISSEAFLRNILPRIIGISSTFSIHSFQGKHALLRELPKRLRAYGKFLESQADIALVVLVDRDREDCLSLKAKLERWATEAGLTTRSSRSPNSRFQVLNRIAVEELESWFFGDLEALRGVYPRVSENLSQAKGFRDPDAIRDTWEVLERLLKKLGYHPGGLPKIHVAREVSAHMDPARNTSRSFQSFRDGLLDLVGAPALLP